MAQRGLVPEADEATAQASRTSLSKAFRLYREHQYQRSMYHFVIAMEDYDNVDEVILKAQDMPDHVLAMQLLEAAEMAGRSFLGPDCFSEGSKYYGHFWDLADTRPYMRTLRAISYVAYDIGDFDKSIATCVRILRLCNSDNMGTRDMLGSLLIRVGRYDDALSFCQAWLDPKYEGGPRPNGGCDFLPPNKDPLSPEMIKVHSSRGRSTSQLLNAALASFHLFGDCELANQYLRLGTEGNPGIMMKILAPRAQPGQPYRRAREINGREDAHDYRWLCQDLWMEMNVWAWASQNQDVKNTTLKGCHWEGCHNREEVPLEYKRCGACRKVYYCSQECQTEDWQSHRLLCGIL